MTGLLERIHRLSRDSKGQTTVEWTLLLAGFGLPMIFVITILLAVLAEHYKMVTFLETLPVP